MPRMKSSKTRRKPREHRLRRLVEFQGIRRLALPQYRDRVRKLYDGPAGAVLALGSLISLHEPLIGHMLREGRYDVSRFGRILDVGSGAGQILRHLLRGAQPRADIIACDLSHRMLKRAKQRLKVARPHFVAADVTQLPFADETFDGITCGWVIEHLPDPRPGLSEVCRILRPGGSALILATEDTFSGAMTSRTWKCRTYNRTELKSACEQSGLPWKQEFWFTPIHRFFKLGGILVEATKCVSTEEMQSTVM